MSLRVWMIDYRRTLSQNARSESFPCALTLDSSAVAFLSSFFSAVIRFGLINQISVIVLSCCCSSVRNEDFICFR